MQISAKILLNKKAFQEDGYHPLVDREGVQGVCVCVSGVHTPPDPEVDSPSLEPEADPPTCEQNDRHV